MRIDPIVFLYLSLGAFSTAAFASLPLVPPSCEEASRKREIELSELLRQRQQAVTEAEASGDRQRLTAALLALGEVLEQQWNNQTASEIYARILAEGAGPEVEIARARKLIQGFKRLMANGDMEEAKSLLQQARDIAQKQGNANLTARVANALGNVSGEQGNSDQAKIYFEEALRQSRLAGNRLQAAIALYNLGYNAALRADYTTSFKIYQEALTEACAVGDRQVTALVLLGFSTLAMMHADFGSALATLHQSRDALAAGGLIPQLIDVLLEIGDIYADLGRDDLAIQYAERSLGLAEQTGDKWRIGEVSEVLALYALLGDNPAKAVPYIERAQRLAEELGAKRLLSNTLLDLADVHAGAGNWEEAESSCRRSLALAEGIDEPYQVARVLLRLAHIFAHREGQSGAAIATARQAARLAATHVYPGVLLEARIIEGKTLLDLGRQQEAEPVLEEAIGILETLRGELVQGAAQRQADVYGDMVRLRAEAGRTDDAFLYAERAKAQVLLKSLRVETPDSSKWLTQEERQQEAELHRALSNVNQRLFLARTDEKPDPALIAQLEAELKARRFEREDFESRLYVTHPSLARRRGMVTLHGTAAIAALLPEHTAVVEFVLLPEQALAFVVKREGTSVFSLPVPEEPLTADVRELRRRLAERNLDFHPLAGLLFDRLLRPLLPALAGVEQLSIVPDGALWDLPFQALESAPGHYLIEDFAISYAPSANVLAEMIGSRTAPAGGSPATARLLAFGNPSIGSETIRQAAAAQRGLGLGPLPDAESEVRAIAKLYGPRGTVVFVGAEASEDRVKREANRYRILHLAAHGLLESASPMYSHMMLARDPKGQEDGLLEAWEMMDLPLHTDLVILSGCETARGRITPGEGLIGMSWALFVAGSSSVVASQWAVDSAETGKLMVEFHRQLLRGQPKALALRRAAQTLLTKAQYRHPYYWAGFILLGDGFSALSPTPH